MEETILQCPICDSTSEVEAFKHHSSFARSFTLKALRKSLVKCKNCNLVCLHPQPTEEALSQVYDKEYLKEQRLYRPAVYDLATKVFLSLIKMEVSLRKKEMLGRGTSKLIWPLNRLFSSLLYIPLVKADCWKVPKALDVGCSSGDGMRLLHEVGWDVYGLDVNKDAIERANDLFPGRAFLGQIEDMNWPDEEFDLVRMSHVLEHLRNPLETLIGIRRILKVGGHLIISMPNTNSLEALLFQSTWHAWDFPHLWHFNRQTTRGILTASGFNPSSIQIHTTSTGFGVALRHAINNFDDLYAFCLRIATRLYNSFVIRCFLFPLEQFIATIGLGNTIVASAHKSREG